MKTFGILASKNYYYQQHVEKAAPFLFLGKGSFASKSSHNFLAVSTTGLKIYLASQFLLYSLPSRFREAGTSCQEGCGMVAHERLNEPRVTIE